MNLCSLAGAAALSVLLWTDARAEITYEGGDGSSVAEAVVITGAQGEADGVESEYLWLDQHYPGYARDGQGLMQAEGKFYDMLAIHKGDTRHVVYFEITGFFGK